MKQVNLSAAERSLPRMLSVGWKLGIAALEATGLFLALHLFTPAASLAGMRFFTNLSSLASLGYFLSAAVLLARDPGGEKTVCPAVKGAVTMALTVTMLVAHFLLGGFAGSASAALILLHYVCPILTLLDWLAFDQRGKIRQLWPVLWTVPPLAYLACTLLAARRSRRRGAQPWYPYGFLNVEKRGGRAVARTVIVLLAGFLALGYLAYWLDRRLAHRGSGERVSARLGADCRDGNGSRCPGDGAA